MYAKLNKLRDKRANGDQGFTLIELLVVVVIIGILVAIAIPVYLNFRKGAENRTAQSDLRNAITTVEQCFNERGQTYPDNFNGDGGSSGASTKIDCQPGDNQLVNLSTGNSLEYSLDGTTYTMSVTNKDTGNTYIYDSSNGQTVKK